MTVAVTPSPLQRYTNHVDGQDAVGEAGALFESVNPTTGRVWGTFVESAPPTWTRP